LRFALGDPGFHLVVIVGEVIVGDVVGGAAMGLAIALSISMLIG
jgi:hypothetical protein